MKKMIALAVVASLVIAVAARAESDIDQDLNRRVNYKLGQLEKSREALKIMNDLGIQPKSQALFEKFDRNDLPRTKQRMYGLEGMINPDRSEIFTAEVIADGFIRCDFRYPVGTDSYAIRKLTREWAEYLGQIGFECFVYFIGSVGQLKVCGYEYDPIEKKVLPFK